MRLLLEAAGSMQSEVMIAQLVCRARVRLDKLGALSSRGQVIPMTSPARPTGTGGRTDRRRTDKRRPQCRADTPRLQIVPDTPLMAQMLALILCVGLLGATRAFPAEPDERLGLDRPSTEEPPKLSECGLDALIGEVFGSSSNSNCNNNNPLEQPGGGDQNLNNYVPDIPPQQNGGGGNQYPNQPGGNQPGGNQPGGNQPGGNGECTCVQYYLCSDNNTINEDGVGLIDIRLGEDDECDNYLLKCCGGQFIRPPDNPVTPPPPVKPLDSKCGVRNADGIGFRITGDKDNEAQYGEFPWMVAVIRPDPSYTDSGKTVSVYQCGGSLIHPQVVLTGAHCVYGKDNLVIRAGEWDTQTKNELYPTQDRKVQQVIMHNEFHNGTLVNDPALLILEKPVDMSVENVGLICLPQANENMDGRNCLASGWGKDQFGKQGKYQVILKRVELPVVPRGPCLESLRRTRLGNRFKLHDSFICAGGIPGKDTCKGDGGGPLVCPSSNNPNIYVQAGIVAWGIDCNTETPGVYVSVPYFVNWIYDKLQAQGISIN